MLSRPRITAAAGIVLAGLIVAATALIVYQTMLRPKTITALFTAATATYPGDDVRVSGVKVGSIAAIKPEGTQVKMILHVARGVPVPADAKAIVVNQNLIAARYVQLTPAYRGSGGPKMRDGAVIPLERTAVPVEWDEVKAQLTRLATDLGPKDGHTPSVARFIDSAANALDGNGEKLRQTMAQLSGVSRILGEGSGNIVETLKNLQTFVTALADSNTQIVQFQDRFATLTSVVNESRSDLDAALTNLSVALGEVQRFIAGTRDKASEQVVRLSDVTQNLVDHQLALENILHIAPNGLANWHGMYNPDTGSQDGIFVFSMFGNPVWAICTQIQALENITSTESAKLCAQHLGPALRLLNFNFMPFPNNFLLSKAGAPENIIYTDPALTPCHRNWDKTCAGDITGTVARAPETPPAISAYTGLPGDKIPYWGPGAFWQPPPGALDPRGEPPPRAVSLPPEPAAAPPPAGLTAAQTQALMQPPSQPPAGPPTVPGLLLPTEAGLS